jgi:hypothetical protein
MRLARLVPDHWFLCLQQLRHFGTIPDLRHPRTFNDKLQWYKLHYRDPIMTKLADKLLVREYVRAKGYPELLNQLLGVYDAPQDIDLSALPTRFVLKANHGSGMNIICRDKAGLDWSASCARMRRWLATRHFEGSREWAYKNIRPLLLCEKYLENENGELVDYKFFCFHGKPELLVVCTDRHSSRGLKYTGYDMHWQRIPVTKGRPVSDKAFVKPAAFATMVEVAAKLSEGFPFLRVDLYEVAGQVVFGELTFYPDAAFEPFAPDHYNYLLGDLFRIPTRRVNVTYAGFPAPYSPEELD